MRWHNEVVCIDRSYGIMCRLVFGDSTTSRMRARAFLLLAQRVVGGLVHFRVSAQGKIRAQSRRNPKEAYLSGVTFMPG